jgi:hypothetical protein
MLSSVRMLGYKKASVTYLPSNRDLSVAILLNETDQLGIASLPRDMTGVLGCPLETDRHEPTSSLRRHRSRLASTGGQNFVLAPLSRH